MTTPEHAWPSGYWYPILDSRSLGSRPRRITRFAQALALWRDAAGRAVAFPAACPHRGADLGAGHIVEGALECPFHGFLWDASGRCVRVPCEGRDAVISRRLDTRPLPIREAHGFVWLWWGASADSLSDPPWFEGLPQSTAGSSTTTYTWRLSLERMMEAILDLHHFPVLHRRFALGIGRRLDPYRAEVVSDEIRVEATLRPDPADPNGGHKSQPFRTRLAFPSVMLSEVQVPVLVVCAPIDAEHVWLHLRFYPRPDLPPAFARIYSWLLLWAEKLLIFPADLEVMLATAPRGSGADTNVLVHADGAIAHWYRLRERALARDRELGADEE